MIRHPIVFGAVVVLLLAGRAIAARAATAPQSSNTLAPDAERQVLDVEQAWVAAEAKRDAVTLRRILDDKFVATFDAKKPYDKEAFIKQEVSEPVDPTESQTLTGETVIIDGDTAIV